MNRGQRRWHERGTDEIGRRLSSSCCTRSRKRRTQKRTNKRTKERSNERRTKQRASARTKERTHEGTKERTTKERASERTHERTASRNQRQSSPNWTPKRPKIDQKTTKKRSQIEPLSWRRFREHSGTFRDTPGTPRGWTGSSHSMVFTEWIAQGCSKSLVFTAYEAQGDPPGPPPRHSQGSPGSPQRPSRVASKLPDAFLARASWRPISARVPDRFLIDFGVARGRGDMRFVLLFTIQNACRPFSALLGRPARKISENDALRGPETSQKSRKRVRNELGRALF